MTRKADRLARSQNLSTRILSHASVPSLAVGPRQCPERNPSSHTRFVHGERQARRSVGLPRSRGPALRGARIRLLQRIRRRLAHELPGDRRVSVHTARKSFDLGGLQRSGAPGAAPRLRTAKEKNW